jgi:Cytochrome oxidase complex assembly protein 1
MDDVINRPQEEQETPSPPQRGGCLRRILLALLLLFAVLACAFFWFTHSVRSEPPYSTALELIQNDPQLIEQLGQPIRNVRWLPSGNFPTQFQIQVKGPQGMADVSVTAGEFEGNWEVTALSARVYDSSAPHETATSLSLDTGGGSGAGGEAPAWSGAAEAPAWPPAGSEGEESGNLGLEPPSGINVELPGGPPGVEIELPESPPMKIELPSVPAAPES